MQRLTLREFAALVGGEVTPRHAGAWIADISVDSRQIASETLFVALKGEHQDGHAFVTHALRNGAAAALVTRNTVTALQQSADFAPSDPLILVDDPLSALCRFAAWCRDQFQGRVIAITGSNGKTIVKDALHRIVSSVYSCSASPGSFNSRLGVALSLIRARTDAPFHVQEAGISQIGDMAALEQMIRPDFGIVTNIGEAHVATMGSRANIAHEKTKLFQRISETGWMLMPSGEPLLENAIQSLRCPIFRCGDPSSPLPRILEQTPIAEGTLLHIGFSDATGMTLPVSTPSQEIIFDIQLAICAAWLLHIPSVAIGSALRHYAPVLTRRQTWKTPNGVTVINDAYTSEPLSLQSALRELASVGASGRRFFVFGGLETHTHSTNQVGKLAAQAGINFLLLVGDKHLSATGEAFQHAAPEQTLRHYKELEAVRRFLLSNLRSGDALLVNATGGASIDRLALTLLEAMAPNRFYVNVQSMEENVARFRRLVGPRVRLLAMVKALAYGSDATRLGLELQDMGVDYLGVSSVDEGSSLRKSGVRLPILVMLCASEEAEKLLHYDLTPVLYSAEFAQSLETVLQRENRQCAAHIELDTGLGRVGIAPENLPALLRRLRQSGHIRVEGIMTHFAVADNPHADDLTHRQMARFEQALAEANVPRDSSLLLHAAATAGAIRFPRARYDMVRIGLGLYGLYPSPTVQSALELVPAIALVSRIVNIQIHRQGDRIGYNGTFVVPQDGFRKAVLPIGYHDGIPVSASNRGHVLINGHNARVCGRVSMDSMTVDVTHIPEAEVGMDALIYGSYAGHTLRPEEAAENAQTIVYELLARLGPRVQRIFVGR